MATNTDASRRIARTVSEALSHSGIPQRDAAARTGIPMATLGRRLTGHSPFRVDELELLADILGVTVRDLFARAQDAA